MNQCMFSLFFGVRTIKDIINILTGDEKKNLKKNSELKIFF